MSRSIYIIIVTLYIVLFYNLVIFEASAKKADISTFGAEALVMLASVWIVFAVFAFSASSTKALAFIFITGNSLVSYFVIFQKIHFDETIIGTIFETNTGEVVALINYKMVLWLLLTLVLPIYLFIFKLKLEPKIDTATKVSALVSYLKVIVLLVTLSSASYFGSRYINPEIHSHARGVRAVYSKYVPSNYLVAFYQYFVKLRSFKLPSVNIFRKYSFNIPVQSNFATLDYNVVLIIGESDRADRHSFLGYKEQTNPFLSQQTNLTVLKDFSACASISRLSVNCMLSYRTKEDFVYPPVEENIISIFKNLGFKTAFLSSQSAYETGNNSFYIAAYLADKFVFSSSLRNQTQANGYIFDEYLLSHIDEVLAKQRVGNFIVIYLSGSHMTYKTRYPSNFNVYKDTYDNSILYTDYVLKQIINRFEDTASFVFYASDHGESLGENGIEGHGSTPMPKEQEHIFAFTWVSKLMETRLSEKYLKMTEKQTHQLNHDNIFYTLTECFDIESDLSASRRTLSLCN